MPQYYALPDQRGIERVPRPAHLSPPYDSIPAVTFSVNGWAGVRVNTVTVDAANDAVPAQHGWRSIVVNLEVKTVDCPSLFIVLKRPSQWPGCECQNFGDPMHSRIDVSWRKGYHASKPG